MRHTTCRHQSSVTSTSFDLIQPLSSSRRRARCQSSWSKGWREGSERFLLDGLRYNWPPAGCWRRWWRWPASRWGSPWSGPVTPSWIQQIISNNLFPCFGLDLQRSLWLQRRMWGIQRWGESVAGEKPRRRGTQCSWNNPSLLLIMNLLFSPSEDYFHFSPAHLLSIVNK